VWGRGSGERVGFALGGGGSTFGFRVEMNGEAGRTLNHITQVATCSAVFGKTADGRPQTAE
jgi:hypothetical protein